MERAQPLTPGHVERISDDGSVARVLTEALEPSARVVVKPSTTIRVVGHSTVARSPPATSGSRDPVSCGLRQASGCGSGERAASDLTSFRFFGKPLVSRRCGA
jgi:hypothetical protein